MNSDELRSLIERSVAEALAAKQETEIKEKEVAEVDMLRARLERAEASLAKALSEPVRFGRRIEHQPISNATKIAEEARRDGLHAVPTFLERSSDKLEGINSLSQTELQDLLVSGLRAFDADGLLS